MADKNLLEIKIRYINKKCKLQKIAVGDWIDLMTACDVKLKAGDYFQIPLGFACKLPDGYEAHIAPRSSTFKKYGLLQTNSIGIIDSSYCGNGDEWQMPVYATRDIEIPALSRLCQFRLMPVMQPVMFTEVEELENTDRGGFGSTGD